MRFSLLIVLLIVGIQPAFAQTAQPSVLTHISALDFSPDGTQLAAGIGTFGPGGCASDELPITIYETASMQQIAELTEHWCTVTSVEYDSSGTKLASSSLDTNAGIWDLTMGKKESLLGTGAEVLDTLWAADGSSILIVGSTSAIIYNPSDWQYVNGFVLHAVSAEYTLIISTAWNQTTHQIAHGAGDGGIYIWDETTGDIWSMLSGHKAEVTSLDWNTTDNLIASGDADGVIKVWNGVTGGEITSFTAHTGAVHDLEWSADGRVFASAGDDGFVRVWFIENSAISMVAEFEYGSAVYAVALNPDATKIAYGGAGINGQNGEVAIADFELASASEIDFIDSISALDFSPDGNLLAVGINGSPYCIGAPEYGIRIIDINTDTESFLPGNGCPIVTLDFNFDGTLLASSDSGSGLAIWDVVSRTNIRDNMTGALQDVAWSPVDNHYRLFRERGIVFEDQNGVYISHQISPNGDVTAATWNAQGTKIAFGNISGSILIWDITSDVIEQTVNLHTTSVTDLDWNPQSNVIASSDESGVINLWNAETGELITTLAAHTGAVHDLEWSADGRVLVSAGDDGFVRVWFIENSAISMAAEFEYGAPVYAVALNPDATKIAYGGAGINGQNGEVAIADLNLAPPSATPAQHQSHITSLVWNSTGTVLAATYSTPEDERRCYSTPDLYSIRLFNMDLTPYKVLSGNLCSINSAAFKPDGTELISIDDTGANYLWDINSGEIISSEIGLIAWEKVVWRPDSTDFARMVDDNVVVEKALRENSIGYMSASDVGFTGKMTDIDWSPDGQFIIAGNEDRTVRIWDVTERNKITQVFQGHTSPIASVAWNRVANSQVVASGDDSGTINIWNVETGEPITTITAHTGAVHDLEWSADGRVFASAGDDGFVRVWFIENAAISMAAEFEYGAPVYAVALNPDATKIAYGGAGINGQNGEVAIADLNLAPPSATPAQHQTHITSLVWNSTGTLLAAAYSTPTDERRCYPPSDRYSIRLFNADLTPNKILTGHLCSVNSTTFSPDGMQLVSADITGTSHIWDIESGEIITSEIGVLSWEKIVWRPASMDFAIMLDDAVAVEEGLRETVKVYLDASGVGFAGIMTDIDWSPDGQFIIAGNEDGTARIWDVSESNKITQVFQEHTNPIASVAWNRIANSQVVANGDTSGVIKVWNAETGELITTIAAHTGAVHDLEWSADGRVLVSTGDDGFVRVWFIENAAVSMVAEFEYGAPVYAVALNPDATKIAYGGAGINGQNGEVAIADLNLDGK